MDICVLNQFFYPYKGGTEKVLFEVYKRLAKRNNVTVITSAQPGTKSNIIEEVEGIKVVRLRSMFLNIPVAPLPFVAMIGLRDAIKRERCDIYHINNRYQYFYGSVASIRKFGGKLALTIHNALPKGIDPIVDVLGLTYDKVWGRRLMHEADLITAISKDTIKTTVPKKELKKTHLVYNGVDYKRFRRISKSDKEVRGIAEGLGGKCESNDANVVTNGRLIEQKGQIYLIRALAGLVKEGHKLGLLIIGRGPLEKRLYSEAHSLGLRGRFWIMNGVEEGYLPYYYNIGDIFAIPSLYESASIAILEALSCELPSIASRVGGLPEMMSRYGMYVQPKSSDDIKEKISYVLENKKKTRSLAKRGRKFIIKRHNWDTIAKRYEELFLNTLHY